MQMQTIMQLGINVLEVLAFSQYSEDKQPGSFYHISYLEGKQLMLFRNIYSE